LPTVPVNPLQAHENEAIATFDGYVNAINKYYQGDTGLDSYNDSGLVNFLQPNGTGDGAIPTGQSSADFSQMRRDGAHQVGNIVARHIRVVDYIPGGNPAVRATTTQQTAEAASHGFDRVVLEECFDPSKVKYIGTGGEEVAVGRSPYVVTVTMDAQPLANGTDSWTISDRQNDLGR